MNFFVTRADIIPTTTCTKTARGWQNYPPPALRSDVIVLSDSDRSASRNHVKTIRCKPVVRIKWACRNPRDWQWFLNDIHVSRTVECQLKMTNVQGHQAPAKPQEMLTKFENSSRKTVAEQPRRSQIPLGSGIEFARRSWQKIRTCVALPLHHDNAPAHTSLKTTEFVTNRNMVIVPHPPCSPDLAPVISLCFLNWKKKKTEWTTFWNSVWHRKRIASGTRQR
jgi:hypothetical protein